MQAQSFAARAQLTRSSRAPGTEPRQHAVTARVRYPATRVVLAIDLDHHRRRAGTNTSSELNAQRRSAGFGPIRVGLPVR